MSQEALIALVALGVQTVVYLLAGYAMVIRNDANSKGLREEVTELKIEVEKLASIIIMQARQEEQLKNLFKRIDRIDDTVEALRRGKGFIRDGGAKSVDREYGDGG